MKTGVVLSKYQLIALYAIIGLLAFVQYSNTFSNDFAWDDDIVIVRNDRVQEGFGGLSKHWTKYNSDKLIDQYCGLFKLYSGRYQKAIPQKDRVLFFSFQFLSSDNS